MNLAAYFSADGLYRFRLEREWPNAYPIPRKPLVFIMLNPSTADGTEDDATVRRCIGFARRWGFYRLLIGNLFALRSTDPRALTTAADPIGRGNDAALSAMRDESGMIVCAWGAGVTLVPGHRERVNHVLQLMGGLPVHHLGLTKDNHPRHPLFLRADAERVVW